jgi:hypothetical protein
MDSDEAKINVLKINGIKNLKHKRKAWINGT